MNGLRKVFGKEVKRGYRHVVPVEPAKKDPLEAEGPFMSLQRVVALTFG